MCCIARSGHAQRAEEAAAQPAPVAAPALHVTLADGTRVASRQQAARADHWRGLRRTRRRLRRARADGDHPQSLRRHQRRTSWRWRTIMAARTLVEQEPNYAYVSARLLLDKLRDEALSFVSRRADVRLSQADMATRYAEYFPAYVKTGIAAELLDPELGPFRPRRLAAALKPERDLQLPVPRPADAVRPLLPARSRHALRAAAGVLHARRDGPCGARDRPRSQGDRVLRPAVVASTSWLRRRRCSIPARCVRSSRPAS